MLTTKKLIFRTLKLLAVVYVLLCTAFYFFQEKLLFLPDTLDKNYSFTFNQLFEEVNIKTTDGNVLNGLLFKSNTAKGLIFYLHGNAGSLESWGNVARRYTDLQYDVFLLDYPGYGKSTSSIHSKSQLFSCLQTAYDAMKKNYPENKIVVLGYSIGTGPAAYLASTNQPRLLILQAPYYSLKDLKRHTYPLLPTFLLKYTFETNEYLKKCKMPIVLFHSNRDEVIYYGSSLKLKNLLKPSDTLITLKGQSHNGMTDNPDYTAAIQRVLQ